MRSRYKLGGRLLLASISAIVLMAMASTTAFATPTNIPMWRSGGAFVPFGTQITGSGQSIAGLNLQYKGNNGIPIWVTCETLSASGKFENPAPSKPGIVTNTVTSVVGPYGTFQGCQLVKYGEKEIISGLECTVPKEIPMESAVGSLTNEASPSGGLKLRSYLKFTVSCPGSSSSWWFYLNGIGEELWEGQEYFPTKTTKVEGLYGTAGVGSVTGEAYYGIGFSDSKGPLTIGERPYEEPASTFGTHWYRGGAERTLGEGPKTLIKEGALTTLTGGSASVNFESNQSGVLVVFSCASGGVNGNVENPVGGGAGVALVSLGFTNCTVQKPEGKKCAIVGSSITTKMLTGVVNQSLEANPVLELKPSGEEIASFTVSGCTVAALNHAYTMKGRLYVRPQMQSTGKAGSWSVPASLNGTGFFSISSQKATASGSVTAETGGEVVTLG